MRRLSMLRILLSLLPLALVACNQAPETPAQEPIRPVKTLELGENQSLLQRRFPAHITASHRAELSFRVPGKIVRLPAKEGDEVTRDQVLAELDSRDYQLVVQDREAKFTRAKADYERGKKLVKQGHISRTDFDRLEANFRSAKAALEKARRDLSFTRLKAPFDGRVARRYVENFEEVQAKQPVMALEGIDQFDVKVDLPENLVRRIRRRQEDVPPEKAPETIAYIHFDRRDRRYPLTFKEIATRADPRTRTFEVTFTMPAPEDLTILSGMSAEMELDLTALQAGGSKNVIEVPASAVFSRPESAKDSYVWVVDEDKMEVQPRKVRLGPIEDDRITILEGLEGTERIVVAGVHNLHPGQKVRLLEGPIGD